MRKIMLLLLILIPLLFIKIPKYKELNNLNIITDIGIDCKNNTIYLKEIIPVKDDDGIEYKYKLHEYHNYNKVLQNKKLYLNHVKKVVTNCSNEKNFDQFNNTIYKNNIKKELSKKT